MFKAIAVASPDYNIFLVYRSWSFPPTRSSLSSRWKKREYIHKVHHESLKQAQSSFWLNIFTSTLDQPTTLLKSKKYDMESWNSLSHSHTFIMTQQFALSQNSLFKRLITVKIHRWWVHRWSYMCGHIRNLQHSERTADRKTLCPTRSSHDTCWWKLSEIGMFIRKATISLCGTWRFIPPSFDDIHIEQE